MRTFVLLSLVVIFIVLPSVVSVGYTEYVNRFHALHIDFKKDAPGDIHCPKNFRYYKEDDVCIGVNKNNFSQSDHEYWCGSAGMIEMVYAKLVDIKTEKKYKYISDMMFEPMMKQYPQKDMFVYIGLLMNSTDNKTFTWANGDKLDYSSAWASGYPKESTIIDLDHRCVVAVLNQTNPKWMNVDCDTGPFPGIYMGACEIKRASKCAPRYCADDLVCIVERLKMRCVDRIDEKDNKNGTHNGTKNGFNVQVGGRGAGSGEDIAKQYAIFWFGVFGGMAGICLLGFVVGLKVRGEDFKSKADKKKLENSNK